MNIRPEVKELEAYGIELRRYFHKHPEPSLEEFNTALKIEEELDKIGILHHRVGETGVYASIQGKKGNGPILVIRADTDALKIQELHECEYKSETDGIMHACGHDAHTATLLMTIKALKSLENDFKGEVRFFFQQSEENGQGARQFVKAGLLQGAGRVIGYHGSSAIESGKVSCTSGPNNASCDFFRIEIKGKSAHVSTPHLSVDALYIASQLVVQLQSIVASNTNPTDTVVVGVGTLNSGTTYNIIADQAVLEGTTRNFSQETRERTNARVKQLAEETAHMYGGEAVVHFEGYANPLVNNPSVTAEMQEAAKKIIGEANIITNQEKRLGADDFADYLQEVPGTYVFVGTAGSDANTHSAHHNGHYDLDEASMSIACSLFLEYALDYLK